jgi:hypothetical protein
MAKIDRLGWADGISFTSYGLRIGIRVNRPDVLERVHQYLPPGWKPARSRIVDQLYSLRVGGERRSANIRSFNMLYAGPIRLARTTNLEELFEPLENDLQLYVAESAPRRIFVHAGVVGWRGQAIVIPGRSFTGKTTLVAALVRAGATYYSDEYAVLDDQGRVHPYPRWLSMRHENGERDRRCPAQELGGRPGRKPLSVGLVLVTEYKPAARWRPRTLSPGRSVLALLANTVPARQRPGATLATLQQVVSHATGLGGARGDAVETAAALLHRLDSITQ